VIVAVIVVVTVGLHLYFREQDGARKGGCSLLLGWIQRIRELELPSSWSLRTRWL
jgi:hypothetical protein